MNNELEYWKQRCKAAEYLIGKDAYMECPVAFNAWMALKNCHTQSLPSTAPVDGGMRWVKGDNGLQNNKKYIVRFCTDGNIDYVAVYEMERQNNKWIYYSEDIDNFSVIECLDESPLPVQQQPTPTHEVNVEEIKKRAEEHADEYYDRNGEDSILWENRKFNFIDGATWQANQPVRSVPTVSSNDGWIYADEKPIVYGDILVCLDDDTILMGRYKKGIVGEWLIYWANEGLSPIEGSNRKVIKWRYLPSTQNSK